MFRATAFILLDLNIRNINIIKKCTDTVLIANKQLVLEVNADHGKASSRLYFIISVLHHCGQSPAYGAAIQRKSNLKMKEKKMNVRGIIFL